jgi:hypothetical protein
MPQLQEWLSALTVPGLLVVIIALLIGKDGVAALYRAAFVDGKKVRSDIDYTDSQSGRLKVETEQIENYGDAEGNLVKNLGIAAAQAWARIAELERDVVEKDKLIRKLGRALEEANNREYNPKPIKDVKLIRGKDE